MPLELIRESLLPSLGPTPEVFREDDGAVSYTHLDVYKRQDPARRGDARAHLNRLQRHPGVAAWLVHRRLLSLIHI